MPTYEYLCPKCGVFEEFHSINSCLTECPKCGAEVKRLISQNNNIIFKGSGFHITDYRSNDYSKKAASDNSNSSSSPSTTSTTPADTKTKVENKAS